MSKVISADGTPIAFDRTGQGPAVILVASALADRSDAAKLAERFTVINYDRRGRGHSGDTGPYAVEREVEDLDALIQTAGGSASVFGSSSGAVLALRAAETGLPTDQIADRLALSPATVRNYLSNAVSKVGGRNRIDAIRIARNAGWL